MTTDNNTLKYENDRITDGFDIFFWVFNDESSFVASHWHQAIEMMYIMDGEVDVIINAQETKLLPGDLFLIDSSVIHSTKSIHGNHAILIQLPYTLLKKYIPNFDDLNFAFDCHSNNPILNTKIMRLIEVIKEMQIIFEINPKGGILRFNSLVFEMLYQLYHNFSTPIPDTDLRKDEKHFNRLKLVMNYTNDHYNRPLSLDEIADVACCQKEYFCCSRSKFLSKIFKINVKNFREIFPDFTHRKKGSEFITVPFLSSGSHVLRLPSAFLFLVPCLEYTLSVLQQSSLTPHISGLYALLSN